MTRPCLPSLLALALHRYPFIHQSYRQAHSMGLASKLAAAGVPPPGAGASAQPPAAAHSGYGAPPPHQQQQQQQYGAPAGPPPAYGSCQSSHSVLWSLEPAMQRRDGSSVERGAGASSLDTEGGRLWSVRVHDCQPLSTHRRGRTPRVLPPTWHSQSGRLRPHLLKPWLTLLASSSPLPAPMSAASTTSSLQHTRLPLDRAARRRTPRLLALLLPQEVSRVRLRSRSLSFGQLQHPDRSHQLQASTPRRPARRPPWATAARASSTASRSNSSTSTAPRPLRDAAPCRRPLVRAALVRPEGPSRSTTSSSSSSSPCRTRRFRCAISAGVGQAGCYKSSPRPDRAPAGLLPGPALARAARAPHRPVGCAAQHCGPVAPPDGDCRRPVQARAV